MPCPTDPLVALMPRLSARARRLARGTAEAEDLVQEVLLRLCRARARRARIDHLDRYAMTVLRHCAQAGWRIEPLQELGEDMAATDPEAPARLACADLAAAINRLPPAQAALMRLVAAGETSPAKLARLLGLPEGTVMSRLARARAALRTDLGMRQGESVTQMM